MTAVKCTAEIEISGVVYRCKFQSSDKICTLSAIEVDDEEECYATCKSCEWQKVV